MKEEVSLTTEDELKIVGTYYPTKVLTGKSVLLLHMLRRDQSVWNDFIPKLKVANFSVLAIDFRGHGASFGNWQQFQAQDFVKMRYDVGAGFDFLRAKDPQGKIAIIGASIGANHALRFARFASSQVSALVLLSPGIDYHGVTTDDYVEGYKGPIFLAAAQDDEYAFSSTITLHQESLSLSAQKRLEIFEKGGHGTEIFKSHPELEEKIITFLNETLK
jgi:pimeloyl-ACP methyl ester carboxylesterase